LIERIGEAASLVGSLREWLWADGLLTSTCEGQDREGAKFSDYFDFGQRIKDSHRTERSPCCVAGTRASSTSIWTSSTRPGSRIRRRQDHAAFGIARGPAGDEWLAETVRLAWKAKLSVSLSADLLTRLKERADAGAISVSR